MERFSNDAQTTLAHDITSVQTSIVVNDATRFPTQGNFRIIVDAEIIKVTSVAGSIFTVIRGTELTSAVLHPAGSIVIAIVTKAAIDAFRSDQIAFGLNINRPIAEAAGRIYFPIDGNGPAAIDNGFFWQPFGLHNYQLITPVASNFSTTINHNAETFVQNGDCAVYNQPGNNQTGKYKTAPATPFTLTVQFSAQYLPSTPPGIPPNAGIGQVGLSIRDGVTGHSINFGFQTNQATNSLAIGQYNGLTDFTFMSNRSKFNISTFPDTPRFLRIFQPSIGNRQYFFSVDGQNFIMLDSEAFNNFVNNVTQVGFALYSDANYGGQTTMILRSYLES